VTDASFQSADRQFGLRISAKEIDRMVSLCRKAKRAETGGVIVGQYNEQHDWAIVTEVTGPPEDSRSGSTWFLRGVRGLQQLIERLWQRDRSFYLGEWHYHPYSSPDPSSTDTSQMRKIADSASYACPEPILLILGGDPSKELQIRAFVFCCGSDYVELSRVVSEAAEAAKPQ
jgi:integrative and conjugative element protein (TIGR02256 family)